MGAFKDAGDVAHTRLVADLFESDKLDRGQVRPSNCVIQQRLRFS